MCPQLAELGPSCETAMAIGFREPHETPKTDLKMAWNKGEHKVSLYMLARRSVGGRKVLLYRYQVEKL